MDTIQKMIANLPPKRATRRVIGEEADIKTRSQATISSVSSHSLLQQSKKNVATSPFPSHYMSSRLSNNHLVKRNDLSYLNILLIYSIAYY